MDTNEQLAVLEEMRDLLKSQALTQSQLLEAQKEYIELYRKQLDRVERINNRAEAIQDKSAQLMRMARKGIAVAMIIIVGLLAYVSWLLFF